MIDLKLVAYKSDEYQEMVDLRSRILRYPLGLAFSDEELKKDESDFLIAALSMESNEVVACCILTPFSEYTVQLRQMAVDSFYQAKGIGGEMINFAEQTAVQHNFRYIHLHARKTAVGFYRKHGYATKGDLFIEVGIPHQEMRKQINIHYK